MAMHCERRQQLSADSHTEWVGRKSTNCVEKEWKCHERWATMRCIRSVPTPWSWYYPQTWKCQPEILWTHTGVNVDIERKQNRHHIDLSYPILASQSFGGHRFAYILKWGSNLFGVGSMKYQESGVSATGNNLLPNCTQKIKKFMGESNN